MARPKKEENVSEEVVVSGDTQYVPVFNKSAFSVFKKENEWFLVEMKYDDNGFVDNSFTIVQRDPSKILILEAFKVAAAKSFFV